MEQSITDDNTEATFFATDTMPATMIASKPFNLGKHFKARVFSFVALSGMVGGCGYVGQQAYYVGTDSFVAPALLSPQNDLVLDAKLKLSSLLLEKGRAEQSLNECEEDLKAGEQAVIKLNNLKDFSSKALTWTKNITGQQVISGSSDLKTLAAQRETLNQMLSRQAVLTAEAQNNLEAGLIQKPDLTKEVQALDTLQLALFENERSRMATNLLLSQASAGQQALYVNGSAPMPEQVMSMNQLITIEVQLLQTEAEMRAKLAEKIKDQEELDKITQLEGELKERPIFKAMDKQQDIAFSPYSSLKGIVPGSHLMDCVWGIFNCRDVGKVVSIIPGETILPDIFGSGQVRGQFITLNLDKINHDESMQSKVLRVRNGLAPMNGDNQVAGK
jgi:hypothetical protein